ncbi:MAG: hypothetical protein H6657_25210 [Ardenticatenaceae bacterium]|nr:hypothetical protein [Ardenticatenaceae bacterium]
MTPCYKSEGGETAVPPYPTASPVIFGLDPRGVDGVGGLDIHHASIHPAE